MSVRHSLVIGPRQLGEPGGYIHRARTWCADRPHEGVWTDEVLICIPGRHRTPREIAVRWYPDGNGGVDARLEACTDTWHTLLGDNSLGAALRDCAHDRLDAEQLCARLTDAGYPDISETEPS